VALAVYRNDGEAALYATFPKDPTVSPERDIREYSLPRVDHSKHEDQ
jgi:hypothetical protein